MLIQISLSLISAAIYLCISFFFRNGSSKVFIIWYVVSALEVILTFIVSCHWEFLSFTETHLMNRMTVFTAIILGDGISVMIDKVVTIVKTPYAWGKSSSFRLLLPH
jgi:hypothetical protein